MKLLVTGLSGLVGSRFRALYQDKYEFVSLDLTNGVDITNQTQVDNLVSSHPDAATLIHLAAYTNVSAAHEQQGDMQAAAYQVNVVGTQNIAAIAKKYSLYLIHVSTDYVFDGTKTTPYTETDPPHPIEWYGKTKYLAEQAVMDAAVKHVIYRIAFPYQSHPMRPDFLFKMMEHLKNNTLPPAFTDHTITPTFVDDIARVFEFSLTHQPTGLYHLVGSSSHTDFNIATLVKNTFALPGDVKPGLLTEYRQQVNRPYQQTMVVSNQKLITDFGMNLKSLPEGLAEIKSQLTV